MNTPQGSQPDLLPREPAVETFDVPFSELLGTFDRLERERRPVFSITWGRGKWMLSVRIPRTTGSTPCPG